MPKPNAFDIPRPFYFESGNHFTGSREDLNFRIVPADGQFQVSIWHGFICSDLAEMEATAAFPLDDDGFRQMLDWLEAAYQEKQS